MLAVYRKSKCISFIRVNSKEQAYKILEFANNEQDEYEYELELICENVSWQNENRKPTVPTKFLWAISAHHQMYGPRNPKSIEFVRKCLKIVKHAELIEALSEIYSPEERRLWPWMEKEYKKWVAAIKALAVLKVMEKSKS